jgi:Transposase DDE domain
MEHGAEEQSAVMLFERNDRLVCEAFRSGEFDYVDAAGELSETDFFRVIASKKVLEKLAASYPSPAKKHDVPLWVYIASNISMRFHGVHQFNAYPFVVRAGGMVQAFGPKMGHKAVHPETGNITLACEGFNDKNSYDRQTPCDADYLRKMARRTDTELLHQWFNRDVTGTFKQHHAFDPEGIFIGDGTYLFVPDNDAYEGSVRLLFDEHNHPVDSSKLTKQEQAAYTWKRCYKLVSLIHTNRAGEFFLYAGMRVVAGNAHECPLLYQLVDDFVEWHGRGIIKRLIVDRGFLDGASIGRCKQQHRIDVLIPAKTNMDIYKDVVGLAQAGALHFQTWSPPAPAPKPIPVHRPEAVRKREETRQRKLAQLRADAPPLVTDPKKTVVRSEVAAVHNLKTFSSCPVPVHAVVNREVYGDGHCDYWVLLDTKPIVNAAAVRNEYGIRPGIEERHRQLKCFSGIEEFSSRAFSLVVNQVAFVLLTYSLLQWYLLRTERKQLNPKTQSRILDLLRPVYSVIVIYYQNYVAFLDPLEYQEMLLTLSEPARQKILAKTRKLRRGLAHQLQKPRAP